MDPSPACPSRHAGWLTAHPVGIAVLIRFVVLFWGPLHTDGRDRRPPHYRPTAPDPPIPRVGYAALFEGVRVADLRQIVDAYLRAARPVDGHHRRARALLLLLDRDPSSRWFAPGGRSRYTPTLQRILLGDLRRRPPKLIIFDDPATSTCMACRPSTVCRTTCFFYLVSRWILAALPPAAGEPRPHDLRVPSVPPVSRAFICTSISNR